MFAPINPAPLFYDLKIDGLPRYYGNYKEIVKRLTKHNYILDNFIPQTSQWETIWNNDFVSFTICAHNNKTYWAARIRNNSIKPEIKQSIAKKFSLKCPPAAFWT